VGLTLADVAARSRVPLSALSAIDEDDYERLPAVTYARGFIRLYAREVGLNPEAIVKAFDAYREQSEAVTDLTPRVTSARRPVKAQRARGNSTFGLAVGAVVTAIVVALLWSPTDGVDNVPVGSEFSSNVSELPLERP
jgi:cytoskeletal protein RodZ